MISNIKRSTIFLAIAPLLLLVISKILLLIGDSASQPFYWVANIVNVVFIFHLIIENKKTYWLSSIALVLIIIGCVGDFFRIMHWPFVAVMVMAGLLGTMIMAGLFLYHSIKTTSKNIHYEQLALSLCLFIQFALSIYIAGFNRSFDVTYIRFLIYLIAALCGAILLKNKYVNLGERNLILYLLINSLFFIIKHIFQLVA